MVRHNDMVISPEMVLGPERKGIKFAYCTYTRPTNDIPYFIRNSDLFICEGTYGDNNDISKAIQKKHMLFREAATLAQAGSVKELWLTHFSPALRKPEKYIDNARIIFKNTSIGEDGKTTTLKCEDHII